MKITHIHITMVVAAIMLLAFLDGIGLINAPKVIATTIEELFWLGLIWLICPIIPILIYMRLKNGYWGNPRMR